MDSLRDRITNILLPEVGIFTNLSNEEDREFCAELADLILKLTLPRGESELREALELRDAIRPILDMIVWTCDNGSRSEEADEAAIHAATNQLLKLLPPAPADDLVSRIKSAREREGLSIRALGDVTGVSFATIARLERGEGECNENNRAVLRDWVEAVERKQVPPAPAVGELEALCQVTEALWFTLYQDYAEHGALVEISAIRAGHAWSALPEQYRSAMPPLPKPGTRKEDVPHVSTCPPIDRKAIAALGEGGAQDA